jgi:phosphatidylglycerol---prolipoprotein diacylglyceryl transferase
MARTTRRPAPGPRPTRPTIDTGPRNDAVQSGNAAHTEGQLPALMERATQKILAVTYWFEPAPHPHPYLVTIRFTGRRVDVTGQLQRRDRFVHDETIAAVLPGSGPISITAKVPDVHPGEWSVTARVLDSAHHAHGPQPGSALAVADVFRPDTWFWRKWAPSVGSDTVVRTCVAPFARVPGALPLIWVTMVTLGIAVALAVQALVIAHDHLRVGPVWAWTLGAIACGIVGAKIWYMVKHPHERSGQGWCIQGFVVGATLAAVILFAVFHAPIGLVLDVSAPGLMLGMSVGRVGCFLAGCCGGPPTAARWGVWSSDQRVGARRVPTQLMESLMSLSLGLAALVAVLSRGPASGAIFVAALAAYTLGREGLLRLRDEPLKVTGPATAAVSALVLVAALVVVVLAR